MRSSRRQGGNSSQFTVAYDYDRWRKTSVRSKPNSPKLTSTKGQEASFLEIVRLIAASRERLCRR